MPESKGTVLVVDDEEPVRKVAADLLTYLGYSVLTSPSGGDAMKALLAGTRPDVVLLDVIMPGMNGAETFRRLREIDPELPILICTGFSDNASVEAFHGEGVSGFVHKPYHMKTLEEQVRKAIG